MLDFGQISGSRVMVESRGPGARETDWSREIYVAVVVNEVEGIKEKVSELIRRVNDYEA